MIDTTKEIIGSISTGLMFKICQFYDWSVTHKRPETDKNFSDFVGEMIEVGFEKLFKESHIHFAWVSSETYEKMRSRGEIE